MNSPLAGASVLQKPPDAAGLPRHRAVEKNFFMLCPATHRPFALSLSKGRTDQASYAHPFMVRQAHHERKRLQQKEKCPPLF
jgi:hypothetical protein